MIKPLSMVDVDEDYRDFVMGLPEDTAVKDMVLNGPYIFLGEIPNMPEHCVVVSFKTGRVFCGYHTDDFHELSEDEV